MSRPPSSNVLALGNFTHGILTLPYGGIGFSSNRYRMGESVKLLSLAVLFLGASQICLAGVYKLTLRRVAPVSEQHRCETFVEETAKEFSRQSGAPVIDYGCEKDNYSARGWDAVITYQAEKPLAFTSTHSSSSYSAALYVSWDECHQRLSSQRDFFSKTTGLDVLTSYCMLDVGTRRFESRIEALGTSELKPEVAAVTLWGTVRDAKSIIANYQAAATAYGIIVFEGGMNGGGFGNHLVVRYYAPVPFLLADYSDMKFDSATACESAASTTKSILQSTSKPAVVFCETAKAGGSAALHVTVFDDVLNPFYIFKVNQLTKRHATMDACQQALRALPSLPEVFGGVCAGLKNEFRIHLFSRP